MPHTPFTTVTSMPSPPCVGCEGCELAGGWIESRPRQARQHQQAGGFVPAFGPSDATFLAIGEAPGETEASEGFGFAGKSGKLIRGIMESVGINPTHDVRWTNVLRCRPPLNRDPTPDEIERCGSLVEQELLAFSGKVVIAVGRMALDRLLGPEKTTALVKSRSLWDGYVYEWGNEIEPAVHIGYAKRYTGEVYKSKTKLHTKGSPKLSRVGLIVGVPKPPHAIGLVACLHPSGVQRSGLSNLEQLRHALRVAKNLADGAPIWRGPNMDTLIQNPLDW